MLTFISMYAADMHTELDLQIKPVRLVVGRYRDKWPLFVI